MTQYQTDPPSSIDEYPDTEFSPGELMLINHPILHSIRLQNHMAAEGIQRTEY